MPQQQQHHCRPLGKFALLSWKFQYQAVMHLIQGLKSM